MSVCLIANPAAGRGSAGRMLPRVRDIFAAAGITDVRVTSRAQEERALARVAASEGFGTIVALGGDGTWSNVARGILDSGADSRLALLAGGTGNDLAFTTGVPARDPAAMARIALGAAEIRIDVGCAAGIHFVNVAGFGFDADVLAASQRVRSLRGPLLYHATAARRLFDFRGIDARVAFDGEVRPASRYLAIIVSNGRRFGGGFLIAPSARVDDGELDAVLVGDASPWRRAVIFGRARGGHHTGLREVELRRTSTLDLTFAAPPRFEADGELHQAESATVEVRCLRRRLRFAMAPA